LIAKAANVVLPRGLSNALTPHIRVDSYLDLWVVRPMNGQRTRLRTSFLLSQLVKPNIAIESGSYLGTTTQYLVSLVSEKTYSIEVNPEFAAIAKARLESDIHSGRIEIVDGDSAVEMPRILRGLDSKAQIVFAYLDAHWLEHIPLRDEVQALLEWGGDFVAVVDDFYIPSDLGYGYDQYKNHRVDISHIPSSDRISVWVPEDDSSTESGAHRGTAYIVSSKFKDLVTAESKNLKLRKY
jgi:predicted O-methyltransferase YrrM